MVASAPDLLQTKLTIPPARAELVLRPRLAEQFNSGLTQPLTLICAPAGFGKTTVVSEWLCSESGSTMPVAWLSLDEDDNDLTRFLIYLVSALTHISIEGADALSMLHSPQPPPAKVILTTLISRLEVVAQRFVLILDDYHIISTSAVHEAMTFLLGHLPPQMSLVVISREDPPFSLARLRGRGQLVEIRADDLRFTVEEAGQFLEQMLGIKLSAAQLNDLDVRTEGWIAGLQLAALAMQGREDLDAFISAFTGSHRFILDYLTEEVLNCQPEAVQNFLLQTSILHRLSGPLCDAVLGSTDGQAMLEQIDRSNLFLIPLDDERYWYRYHHLFGDMLQNRLKQTAAREVSELHRRASRWFIGENLIEEAVNHAIAADDFELAVSILEGPGNHYFTETRTDLGIKWARLLPEAVIAQHPRLTLNLGLLSVSVGHYDIAQKRLQDARSALDVADIPQAEMQELNGYVDLIDAHIAFYHGETAQALERAAHTLILLPPDSLHLRYLALSLIGTGNQRIGELEAAVHAFSENIAIGKQLNNVIMITRAMLQAAEVVVIVEGRLSEAETMLYQALDIAMQWKPISLFSVGMIHGMLSMYQFEQNRLEEAIASAWKCLEYCENYYPLLTFVAYLTLTRAYQATGDFDEMTNVGQKLEAVLNTFPSLPQMGFNLYVMRFWLIRDVVNIDRYLVQDGNSRLSNPPYAPLFNEMIVIRRHLAEGTETPENILTQLDQLEVDFEAKGIFACLINVLILKVTVLNGQKRIAEAERVLERAVLLAEPRGIIRIFVDEGAPMAALLQKVQARGIAVEYVTKLLPAFELETDAKRNSAGRQIIGEQIEPLSDRELEVLSLIADGASNREIAQQLVISIGTVKKHLNNIFLKLDARSRTQAIATARNHNLL